jgi:hypothetical protein
MGFMTSTIYQKFNQWSSSNKLMKIFKALVQAPDLEWEFINGSIVKSHQHSAGAATKENQAIGKSKGGNTTKIHMAVDAYGLPIDFELKGHLLLTSLSWMLRSSRSTSAVGENVNRP